MFHHLKWPAKFLNAFVQYRKRRMAKTKHEIIGSERCNHPVLSIHDHGQPATPMPLLTFNVPDYPMHKIKCEKMSHAEGSQIDKTLIQSRFKSRVKNGLARLTGQKFPSWARRLGSQGPGQAGSPALSQKPCIFMLDFLK